jgi:hypothetical protein
MKCKAIKSTENISKTIFASAKQNRVFFLQVPFHIYLFFTFVSEREREKRKGKERLGVMVYKGDG